MKACNCARLAIHWGDQISAGGNYLCARCGGVCCDLEDQPQIITLMDFAVYNMICLLADWIGPIPQFSDSWLEYQQGSVNANG